MSRAAVDIDNPLRVLTLLSAIIFALLPMTQKKAVVSQIQIVKQQPFPIESNRTYSATAFFNISTLSNFSHGKSKSVRPKCP